MTVFLSEKKSLKWLISNSWLYLSQKNWELNWEFMYMARLFLHQTDLFMVQYIHNLWTTVERIFCWLLVLLLCSAVKGRGHLWNSIYLLLILSFQLNLTIKTEKGDTSTYVLNGEWHLLGTNIYKVFCKIF